MNLEAFKGLKGVISKPQNCLDCVYGCVELQNSMTYCKLHGRYVKIGKCRYFTKG